VRVVARDILCPHLLCNDVIEVDFIEVSVVLHIFGAVLEVTIALREVVVCQMSNQTLGSTIEPSRKPDLLTDNHFEDLVRVVVHVGTPSYHHLIDEDAERVPVYWFTMAFVENDLRCQIFRSTTESIGSFARFQLFDKSKIRKL
jgi:hypothetical protein